VSINRKFNHNLSWYNGILSFSSILAALFYGSWSDDISRKFPIIVVILCSLVAQAIFITYFQLANFKFIYLFYICALVSGLSGGNANLIASSSSYLADITHDQNRAKRLSIIEGMLFLGQYLGYNAVSFIIKLFADKLVYGFVLLASIFSFLLLYTCCYLKETNEFGSFNFSKVFRLRYMFESLNTVFKPRETINGRQKLLILIFGAIIAFFLTGSETNLLFIYLKNPPFNWSSSMYGYYKGFNSLLGCFSLLFIPTILNKFYPIVNKGVLYIMIGFVFRCVTLLYLAFSFSTVMVFFTPCFFALGELTMPFIRSSVCDIVGPQEKGKTFAVISLIHNIVLFISSLIFIPIFNHTRQFFPGLSFAIVGVAQLIPLIFFK